jgi:RNA polymerase sigma-70 factor, ECF subfamily
MVQAEDRNKINIQSIEDYENVFRTYYNGLCRYASTWIDKREDAEEIVQTVFVKLWEKREDRIIEISIKSYLYKSVYHSALNYLKHQKIKRQYMEMNKQGELAPNAGENLQTKELRHKINAAINALPEQCRLVYKLSRFENLKYKEISNVLNISIKTVENHMGKALRLMRENLSEYITIWVFYLVTFFNLYIIAQITSL